VSHGGGGDAERHPLSFPQLRLLFLHELQGSSTEYHIPEVFRLSGPVDVAALERALGSLAERHESLRTAFVLDGEEPAQIVQEAAGVPLAVEEPAAGSEEEARRAAIAAALAEEWDRPFDLAAGRLLRARLLRFGEQDHALVVTTHHIASDGWSQRILRRELGALYGAHRSGVDPELPPLSHRYVDFARWQRDLVESDALQPSIAYWTQALGGLPEEGELSFRRPREATGPSRGLVLTTRIDPELTTALRQLSRSSAATLYMTLLAAFALLLAREGGARDFAIATPIAGRQRAEFEPVVGFFVNTLALRFALGADATLAGVIDQTRASTLHAYEHQHVPFERVVQELAPRRAFGRLPLVQVLFGLNDGRDDRPGFEGLDVEAVELATVRPRFDVEVHVFERPADLQVYWVCDEAVIPEDTATALLHRYLDLLAAALR
jgi:hypothetical protein